MFNNLRFNLVALSATIVATVVCLPHCRAQTLEWTRQWGTSSTESSGDNSVSADGMGNVYVSGRTEGSLAGTNKGRGDAFVTKYDAAGNLLWTRQAGTGEHDYGLGTSADGLGSVYVSGITEGSLGGPNFGRSDAFLAKYDALGTLLWTRQLGTSAREEDSGVSADGLGNVYLSGTTQGSLGGTNLGERDVFIVKYTADGNLEWTRQLGTSALDLTRAVSADGLGNVYLSGWTSGSLGGASNGGVDAFVAKYDSAGMLLWTRQLGTTGDDRSSSVSADGLGNVYLSGWTEGSLDGPNAGGEDAFVAKYDGAGNQLWIRQFGSNDQDAAFGVSADRLGNVYLSGYTHGDLDGTSSGGTNDAYLAKYDASGNLKWTRQLVASGYDLGQGVSADGLGSVFLSGYTSGDVGGPNLGEFDVFVAKFSDATPGDFNSDGAVDGADFLAWQQGRSPAPLSAEDLAAWKQNFGHSGTATGAAAVPEPNGLLLMATSLAAVLPAGRALTDRRRAAHAPAPTACH